MAFRWIDWNRGHIAKHGVTPDDAEYVVQNAREPFPWRNEMGRYLVWGRARDGRLLQVVFALDPDGTMFVFHARPLSKKEQQQWPEDESLDDPPQEP